MVTIKQIGMALEKGGELQYALALNKEFGGHQDMDVAKAGRIVDCFMRLAAARKSVKKAQYELEQSEGICESYIERNGDEFPPMPKNLAAAWQ